MSENKYEDRISELRERIAVNEAAVSAAHKRIDRLEEWLKDEMRAIREDIKTAIRELSEKVEPLTGMMNYGKGWAACALLMSAAVGWLAHFIFGK